MKKLHALLAILLVPFATGQLPGGDPLRFAPIYAVAVCDGPLTIEISYVLIPDPEEVVENPGPTLIGAFQVDVDGRHCLPSSCEEAVADPENQTEECARYASVACQRPRPEAPDSCQGVARPAPFKPKAIWAAGCICDGEEWMTDGTIDVLSDRGDVYCSHYENGELRTSCDWNAGTGKVSSVRVGNVAPYSHPIGGYFNGGLSGRLKTSE